VSIIEGNTCSVSFSCFLCPDAFSPNAKYHLHSLAHTQTSTLYPFFFVKISPKRVDNTISEPSSRAGISRPNRSRIRHQRFSFSSYPKNAFSRETPRSSDRSTRLCVRIRARPWKFCLCTVPHRHRLAHAQRDQELKSSRPKGLFRMT
jgi:hypothetical protein